VILKLKFNLMTHLKLSFYFNVSSTSLKMNAAIIKNIATAINKRKAIPPNLLNLIKNKNQNITN